MYYKYKWIRF